MDSKQIKRNQDVKKWTQNRLKEVKMYKKNGLKMN